MKQFAKPHVARALGGKICAATVTPGKANDSPYLREMPSGMPRGYSDVLGDSQYGGVKNCRAVRDGVRRRIIEPRPDHTIGGGDARAGMLGFPGERPGTFRKLLRKRNDAESVFSPVKEGLGGAARAAGAKTRAVELPSTRTCRDMAFA